MSHIEDWLTKQFDFDFPVSRYPELLGFLRTTPERLASLVDGLPKEMLTRRIGDSWSIQENTGHLLTVEFLFIGRLEDYNNNANVLRPAQFEDNQTDKANYNEIDIAWILEAFKEKRNGYLSKLDAFRQEEFGKTSLHPRLNKPMRLCDMLLFQAEHDRHHLTRIEEIKAEIVSGKGYE